MKNPIFLVLVYLFVSAGSAMAQQGWVVTPGDGVGAITVGMSPDATKLVVTPTREVNSKGMPALVEYGTDLVIEYRNRKASIISLHSNSIKTKNGSVSWTPYNGAAIGTPWNTVVGRIPGTKLSHKLPTAKGHPEEIYHAYQHLGIGFRIKGGSIVRVDIW